MDPAIDTTDAMTTTGAMHTDSTDAMDVTTTANIINTMDTKNAASVTDAMKPQVNANKEANTVSAASITADATDVGNFQHENNLVPSTTAPANIPAASTPRLPRPGPIPPFWTFQTPLWYDPLDGFPPRCYYSPASTQD